MILGCIVPYMSLAHTEEGMGALDHLCFGWAGQNKLIIQIIDFFLREMALGPVKIMIFVQFLYCHINIFEHLPDQWTTASPPYQDRPARFSDWLRWCKIHVQCQTHISKETCSDSLVISQPRSWLVKNRKVVLKKVKRPKKGLRPQLLNV